MTFYLKGGAGHLGGNRQGLRGMVRIEDLKKVFTHDFKFLRGRKDLATFSQLEFAKTALGSQLIHELVKEAAVALLDGLVRLLQQGQAALLAELFTLQLRPAVHTKIQDTVSPAMKHGLSAEGGARTSSPSAQATQVTPHA